MGEDPRRGWRKLVLWLWWLLEKDALGESPFGERASFG